MMRYLLLVFALELAMGLDENVFRIGWNLFLAQ